MKLLEICHTLIRTGKISPLASAFFRHLNYVAAIKKKINLRVFTSWQREHLSPSGAFEAPLISHFRLLGTLETFTMPIWVSFL